jgi:hypothetical protein
MTAPALYDRIGRSDTSTRRPDQRIAPPSGQLSSGAVDRALDALAADLATGRWQNKQRSLPTASELHLGNYVIVAEPNQIGGRT